MPVSEGDGNWEDEPDAPVSQDDLKKNSTTLGPDLSSQAPEVDSEPHPVTAPEPEQQEPLPEFDERYKQDLDGLLYLGKLTHTFYWVGHKFVIRTLTVGELLEVGLLHKHYVGTLADVKAYQAAVLAASVETVDDKPLSVPLTNEVTDTQLRSKFDYVLRSWFPPVLDVVYEQYLILEDRVQKVIEAMGKGVQLR